jgi:hypothetical protein
MLKNGLSFVGWVEKPATRKPFILSAAYFVTFVYL